MMMCSLSVLFVTVLIAIPSATSYGFDAIPPTDQSTLTKLMEYLVAQTSLHAEPETGQCGSYCYIVDGVVKLALREGEEYTNPDVPCETHRCTSNGVVKQVITCESTDNIEPCPNGGRVIHIPGECCAKCETPDPPTDEFNEWGEWTTCTKTCGRGAHARRRNCLISENGTSVDCFGEKLQIRDCNAQQCLIKCVWKEWSDWNSCSVTCGIGTEERTREPISAYYFGPNCEGDSRETQACYRENCQNSECPATHSVCGGQCIPDMDHDCIDDTSDNCPQDHNTDQLDHDKDTIGNACDNCEDQENFDQSDNDNDGRGDDCDDDSDNDGISDRLDNCRFIANYKQLPSEVVEYGSNCVTSGNGIIIEYDDATAEERKGMIAEIMQMLFQLFSAN